MFIRPLLLATWAGRAGGADTFFAIGGPRDFYTAAAIADPPAVPRARVTGVGFSFTISGLIARLDEQIGR
jgi:hypothetical protein